MKKNLWKLGLVTYGIIAAVLFCARLLRYTIARMGGHVAAFDGLYDELPTILLVSAVIALVLFVPLWFKYRK